MQNIVRWRFQSVLVYLPLTILEGIIIWSPWSNKRDANLKDSVVILINVPDLPFGRKRSKITSDYWVLGTRSRVIHIECSKQFK